MTHVLSLMSGGIVVLAAERRGVKRCQFDLKFDVEPFEGILRPSIGSDRRFVIFNTVAAGSSCSAVGGLKLGQMVSKWPETSCVPFFGLL